MILSCASVDLFNFFYTLGVLLLLMQVLNQLFDYLYTIVFVFAVLLLHLSINISPPQMSSQRVSLMHVGYPTLIQLGSLMRKLNGVLAMFM